ncbi:MAG: glycosyltransferase [Chloroflexota bacterium]|nr:glycosyltransferase [Chloroflexota bacterium]
MEKTPGTTDKQKILERKGSTKALKVGMHVLGRGRTDARVLREASALAQSGCEVWIIDIEIERTRAPIEHIDGLHYKHIFLSSWNTPARFKAFFLLKLARAFLWGTVLLLRTPVDIYHAHEDNALVACYFAALLRRKPLIFDAHELPLVSPQVTRWRRLHALAVRVVRIIVARCAAIISPSPPLIAELQKRYGGREAVLLRNLSPYQAPISSNRLRERLGIDAHTHIALYQGYLSRERGLDIIIRAARFLAADSVIVLMGEGEGRPDLEALIRQEGVEERVKMLPAVPYAELLSWTASSDVGLIIYRAGSPNVPMMLPNKLFEYLMAGIPVLASPLAAVVEIVESYQVGRIVRSQEPEEIGQALTLLLNDTQARRQMRSHALAASLHDLCWEKESHKLIQLYEDVMGVPLNRSVPAQ